VPIFHLSRWKRSNIHAIYHQHGATRPTDGRGAFGFVAFSTLRLLRAG
jgi:hypothetical protein